MPELAPGGDTICNKKGGVCSIRNFISDSDGDGGLRFGPITATCPNRFLESGLIFCTIGETILGNPSPLIVKEIPFLQRFAPKNPAIEAGLPAAEEIESDEEEGEGPAQTAHEDVGRIDMVCVHPGDRREWCAVELQAVYFSGGAMSKDFRAIREYRSNGIPLPGANRRPDFRSSGPKRLMPQLQIKVPTLRRWGKKIAVVVDRPFFDALGEMDHVSDVSNADIVWVIVDFDEDMTNAAATMRLSDLRFTTLERAVEGLTAGFPTTKAEFEAKITAKLQDKLG